jgi:hypothetical protein
MAKLFNAGPDRFSRHWPIDELFSGSFSKASSQDNERELEFMTPDMHSDAYHTAVQRSRTPTA